jgi:DNA-binding transcriptional regulator GbsR (MarR family)
VNHLEKLQSARERVIESIARNMDLYGVTHSFGRLYGTMYFHDVPMTLDDMGKALGMSKTSMSAGVKVLSDLNMVEKVWIKGERKDRYKVEEDWYQTFFDFFMIKWRKRIEMNMEAIKRTLVDLNELLQDEQVEEEIKKLASRDLEKLNHAIEYYEWLNRLIDSFETHEIFKFIPKKTTEQS